MQAKIIAFPADRCRQALTADQLTEAGHAACREIYDQAAADHLERSWDGRAVAAMMMLACEGACPVTMIKARAWLMRECGVRVTDAA